MAVGPSDELYFTDILWPDFDERRLWRLQLQNTAVGIDPLAVFEGKIKIIVKFTKTFNLWNRSCYFVIPGIDRASSFQIFVGALASHVGSAWISTNEGLPTATIRGVLVALGSHCPAHCPWRTIWSFCCGWQCRRPYGGRLPSSADFRLSLGSNTHTLKILLSFAASVFMSVFGFVTLWSMPAWWILWCLLALFIVWAAGNWTYLVGVRFGKKAARQVSPNKDCGRKPGRHLYQRVLVGWNFYVSSTSASGDSLQYITLVFWFWQCSLVLCQAIRWFECVAQSAPFQGSRFWRRVIPWPRQVSWIVLTALLFVFPLMHFLLLFLEQSCMAEKQGMIACPTTSQSED